MPAWLLHECHHGDRQQKLLPAMLGAACLPGALPPAPHSPCQQPTAACPAAAHPAKRQLTRVPRRWPARLCRQTSFEPRREARPATCGEVAGTACACSVGRVWWEQPPWRASWPTPRPNYSPRTLSVQSQGHRHTAHRQRGVRRLQPGLLQQPAWHQLRRSACWDLHQQHRLVRLHTLVGHAAFGGSAVLTGRGEGARLACCRPRDAGSWPQPVGCATNSLSVPLFCAASLVPLHATARRLAGARWGGAGPPPPPPSLAATPSPPPNDSLFRSHVRLVNGPSPCSPKGTFNSDTAGDSCMPCAAGRFSPTLGSKECKVRQGRVGRAAAHARACGGAPSRRPPIGRQLCAGPDPPGSVPHLLEASFMIGWRPPLVLRRPAPLAPTPRLSPRAASIAAPATLPPPAALRATPGEAGAARGGVVLGKQACNPW